MNQQKTVKKKKTDTLLDTLFMKYRFYLRKEKQDKHGKCPIYIQVNHLGLKIRKPTGEVCRPEPEFWNPEGVVLNDKLANKGLSQLRERLEDLIFDTKKSKSVLTVAKIEQAISNKEEEIVESKSFFEFWDEWIEESRNRISSITNNVLSPNSIKRYHHTKSFLTQFQTKYNYPLNSGSINELFYVKFSKFILKDHGNNSNTLSNHIKIIKVFCKWYQKKDQNLNNDFREFKKSFTVGKIEPLKPAEIKILQKAKLDERLSKVRDIFLFICYTGLRISDYKRLRLEHVEKDCIRLTTQKTNTECYIPFYDDQLFKPVALFKKYKGILPVISDQKVNEYLGELGKHDKVKITRTKMTTRTGRKTFASIKLLQGVPPEVIMKSTGHKTRAAFDAYVGIDTSDILKQYRDKAINLKVS